MAGDFTTRQHLQWERRCLRRIADGDRGAFGELYRMFAEPLYSRVLLPRLGQRSAAEDALSETFRTALEKLEQYRERGTSVYFWLARIAANKAMDMHRARAVSGRALVNMEAQLSPLLATDTTPDSVTPHAALEIKTEQGRARGRMEECMAALNPRYRKVLQLRFLQELPREQCAREMDVKVGTLDVLVLRALRALKKEWQKRSTVPPESSANQEAAPVKLGGQA